MGGRGQGRLKGGHRVPVPRLRGLGLAGGAPRVLGLAGLEAVLEFPGDALEVAGAAGADSLSSLRLLGPVVCGGVSMLCRWPRAIGSDVVWPLSGRERKGGNIHLRILAEG